MKLYNPLITILLALNIVSCGDSQKDKENYFSFDENNLKPIYQATDKVDLSLLNTKNKIIDSVAYFVFLFHISFVLRRRLQQLAGGNVAVGEGVAWPRLFEPHSGMNRQCVWWCRGWRCVSLCVVVAACCLRRRRQLEGKKKPKRNHAHLAAAQAWSQVAHSERRALAARWSVTELLQPCATFRT